MAVTKKPKVDADKFIDNAKADNVKTDNLDTAKPQKQTKGKPDNLDNVEMNMNRVKCGICGHEAHILASHIVNEHGMTLDDYEKQYGAYFSDLAKAHIDKHVAEADLNNVKPQKRTTVKTAKKKLTFYMDNDMYLKWKEYEFKQLQTGKKVSFQGVVEKYMSRILK
jgi:hypothetical protein